jgi:hypothetical protein
MFSQMQQRCERHTRRKKLSQNPAAVRMRRSRFRKWSGAVALPPLDILPDLIERLASHGWLDPVKAKKGDAKAIGTAIIDLAQAALKAGAKPPDDDNKLVAVRFPAEGIQALADYYWLGPLRENQRPSDIRAAIFDIVNAALKAQLYGKHRPRSFVNPRRPT